MKIATIATLTIIAASITPTPPAHADDDSFWEAVQSIGLDTQFSTRNQAISLAKTMCDSFRKGYDTPLGRAAELADKMDVSEYKAEEFVGMSMAEYCPDLKGLIGQ